MLHTKPKPNSLGVAEKILRYLQRTTNYGISYWPTAMAKLLSSTDSDWTDLANNYRRSTTGYAFALGFGMFLWASKK